MPKVHVSVGKFQPRTGAAVAGLAALAAFFMATQPALADTMDIRKSDNSFSVDVGGSYLDYAESKSNGGTFDSEKGWLPTVGLGVGFLSDEEASPFLRNLYGRLEGRVSAGTTNYDGALQLFDIPYSTTTDDRVYSIAAQMGRAFPLGQEILLTPFAEIGYRHWNRDILGSGFVSSSSETYTNWDVLGGLLVQYSPDHHWVVSGSGAGGSTFSAGMTNRDVGDFSLGNDVMWRIRGKVGYLIADKLELTGTAEYQSFGFGASQWKPVGNVAYMEPDSTTHQTTLLAGVSYHFF